MSKMLSRFCPEWIAVAFVVFSTGAFAESGSLATVEKAPPAEVAAAVAQTLQSSALQVIENEKPILEFWFSSAVTVPTKPESSAKGLESLRETTLLGVVAVHGERRDYRDDPIPSGTYTIRYAFQPQDGNHLGSAEYVYFAVLVPVKYDAKPDGITKYGPLMKASGKDTPSGHPMVLSIRPVGAEEEGLPKLAAPAAAHRSVRLKLPIAIKGTDEKAFLTFDLVFEGKGHT